MKINLHLVIASKNVIKKQQRLCVSSNDCMLTLFLEITERNKALYTLPLRHTHEGPFPMQNHQLTIRFITLSHFQFWKPFFYEHNGGKSRACTTSYISSEANTFKYLQKPDLFLILLLLRCLFSDKGPYV